MGNIKSVLKEMFPGASAYSPEQVAAARRVMLAAVTRRERSSRAPSIYVEIGGTYRYLGVEFRCVRRPNVVPRDACRGCDLGRVCHPCPAAIQCSKFDRRDGKFVWFVRVDG